MINYIYAKVIYISKKYIIVESNFIGYKIFINDHSKYEINKYFRIYLYKNIRFDKNIINEELYGFNDIIARNLFVDLLSINGIGTITASNIIKNDINLIINYIVKNDYQNLKELNYINEKNAILICNALSGKYKNYLSNKEIEVNENNNVNNDLVFALKQLGYNKEEINYALSNCDNSLSLNDLINSSIRLIAKNNSQSNNV